jgi:GMP synthase (glutamine-hydrolysing)
MVRLACVHHLERPFLGHAAGGLRSAGVELVEVFRREGDDLPDLGTLDGVVSLGGEQSVLHLDREPALRAEVAWLSDAVERGVPVLGVCLGAQLLAHAGGATVRRLPRRRLGWAPLRPTAAAVDDPLFGRLPAPAFGLYWNEDGFDTPPGAVDVLALHDGSCAAFRLGDSAWGVQFHPEVDGIALEGWYRDWSGLPAQAGVDPADARRVDARMLSGQAPLSATIFGGFARLCR